MKELDKEFSGRADQKAFRFHQLQRTNTHALYGQTINLEAKERFPLSSEWGTLGWTFQSLEDAKRKFYSLSGQ